MSNIILCGFKGCGKTTLGKKLAERLQLHFIDTDQLIATNCRDFYINEGKEAFRRAEKQVIVSLLEFSHCIIATGGGAVEDPENVMRLKSLGAVFYLAVDKSELERRLKLDPPPFFDLNHFHESFEAIYQSRLGIYEAMADYVVHNEEDVWEVIHSERFSKLPPGENPMEKRLGLLSTAALPDSN